MSTTEQPTQTDSVVGVLVDGREIIACQGTWQECDDFINSHMTPPEHIARWELRDSKDQRVD